MNHPTEESVRRVAQLLSFELPLSEIRARLADLSEGDFFLVYKAAKRLSTEAVTCEHGVPLRLRQRLRTSYYEPDIDRCAPCRKQEQEEQERQEAETNAFITRLAARRKAL